MGEKSTESASSTHLESAKKKRTLKWNLPSKGSDLRYNGATQKLAFNSHSEQACRGTIERATTQECRVSRFLR